jgi:uncharacterized alpha-E superfamily protein
MYVAAAGDSYAVMPGGLTRIAATADTPIVSMQRGGGSKDTWVLSDGPVSPMSLLAPPAIGIQRERRSGDLPSRVADNLFWLGRHAERAEHTTRLLRTVVARLSDEDTTEETIELGAMLQLLVELGVLPARFRERMPLRDLEQELLSLLFKQTAGSAIRQTFEEVRRIASAVRDRLSIDTWRILNQLRQDFRVRHGRIQANDVLMHLNQIITDLAAFSGMEMENMTRGHGWRFLDIGRRLERALNMSTLLRGSLSIGEAYHAILGPLLDVADSTMTYRRQYFEQPQLVPVLDLLVADTANARALAFQLVSLREHVDALPRDTRAPSPTQEQRIIAHMIDVLEHADFERLGEPGVDGRYGPLSELFVSIDADLRSLSEAITYYYFSHAELRVS